MLLPLTEFVDNKLPVICPATMLFERIELLAIKLPVIDPACIVLDALNAPEPIRLPVITPDAID